MGEYITRTRKFFRFTQEEVKNVVIIILVFTFMLGFDDGSDSFQVARWVANLVGCFFMVLIGVLIHVGVTKIAGIFNGVRTEQQLSWGGLGIGLILTVITGGMLPVYLPGSFKPYQISTLRVGSFRGGLNNITVGYIALAGPVANIVIAMFAKFLLFQVMGIEALWLDKFIFFNFLLAFYTMMPIPGQAGLMVFFGSRLWYAIGFGTVMGYVILFIMGIFSLIGAVAIGFLVWLVYYVFFERRVW